MSTPQHRAPPTPRPERAQTVSYTRFRTPTHRDEAAADADGAPASLGPSTLPPAPFENEIEVSGHEWWLEAHMNAASNVLFLEQLVDAAMDTADVLALERARAIVEQLAQVRDALYELYCDAADPRLHGKSQPDGALTSYILLLYGWSERVAARLATFTGGLRGGAPDWAGLATALEGAEAACDDATRARIEAALGEVVIDVANPVEPLRHLPKDLSMLFASATALRDELRRCVA